jgi:hypothetical protein
MMWRVALAVWLTAALSLFAFNAPRAQFNGCQAGFCSPPSSAAAAYVGPGDITSGAIAFYSCSRAYNAAYASGLNAACDVVDTATGLVTGTMHFLSTGFVNVNELTGVGQACHAACSVTKMYDQTGTGNHVVQATLANMPALTFNAQNGLPCAAGGANSPRLVTAGNITQAAPFTMTAVTERGSGFTTLQNIQNNGNLNILRFPAVANQVSAVSGTASTLTATDSAFHALLAVVSATAPLFAADSSANTSTATFGTSAMASTEAIVGRSGGQGPILAGGFVCEAGIWPADLNSSYQAMLANMRSATNGWNF